MQVTQKTRHQVVKDQWESGAVIQYRHFGKWVDCADNKPAFHVNMQYRVRPTKEDVVYYTSASYDVKKKTRALLGCTKVKFLNDNLKLVFCPHTGALKEAVILGATI
jgi:hypothetical protein